MVVVKVTMVIIFIFIFFKIEFTFFCYDLRNLEKVHFFPPDEKCNVCLHPNFYKIVFYKAEGKHQVHVGAVT